MSTRENRHIIIERVRKEIIGPGSDIFQCKEDFSDETIDSKPLQRYFSGILFPKQLQPNASDNGEQDTKDEDTDDTTDFSSDFDKAEIKEKDFPDNDEDDELNSKEDDEPTKSDTQPKYVSNTFFPSHYGITFSLHNSCTTFKAIIRFGNYRKAEYAEIKLPYNGEGIHLLPELGLNDFVAFDEENKVLIQKKKIQRIKQGKTTSDYQLFQDGFNALRQNTSSNYVLYKAISKLFFKDKYKRNSNEIEIEIKIEDILKIQNQHLILKLAEQPNCDSEKWKNELKENLVFHVKLYTNTDNKFYIKAVLENKTLIAKKNFSLSKEKLNAVSCFQSEIEILSDKLLPFKDYKKNLYKTEEDKMLDYLYRDKLAFGIGHNTACTWENAQSPHTPQWIKSTFLPYYDVKSQSSETNKIKGSILSIKNLSVYNTDKTLLISNLNKVASSYKQWIEEEQKAASNNELGLENIEKCKEIFNRIDNGIKILSENSNALRAFQLANTAIYLQMFQSEMHFIERKEGYEVYNRHQPLQHKFEDYGNLPFPADKQPEWRPFQLAFILQCLASFVQVDSPEKELVDLLYFPTGGGKTEAYLALSAFLIFWRRIQYPNAYAGVNIIIRYTLRLLSAQQFERASKMVLACEFIRNHYKDLGDTRISIGFWVGKQTIANHLDEAKQKLEAAQRKLNKGDGFVINPFQLSNCQWCNTKIISRLNESDYAYQIGHRINKQVHSYCLNDACFFSIKNGGLPIVLVDEDIYAKPPTILFATVDKFATIAWKEESTSFFNSKNNRKPELIIQDELHLLNGTLGSLVGLFENALLKLCDNPKIIASTATVKNVDRQIEGLYNRKARVFPQYATNSDDTFFSKVIEGSKRRYIGILPTGKTTVVTNLQLLAALLYGRLEVWQEIDDKGMADQFWTLLSYFKSLKELGRFANKIKAELKPIIKQLQVRYLNDNSITNNNYKKLSYSYIELTSRIPNEKIKRNLDKLDIKFKGDIEKYKAYDLVLATNMISVGLDVGRLGIMVMNGMPPNTAEYIQASSRVARTNEGLVITLYDPFSTRDLSYFEDFVQFHKTFYKQVEPLSVTPFAENALDKMLFTLILAYFRHTTQYTENNKATALLDYSVKNELRSNLSRLFAKHSFVQNDLELISEKVEDILNSWVNRVQDKGDIKYYLYKKPEQSLVVPLQEKINEEDNLVAMQSMRSVEPSTEISIRPY